MSKRKKRQGSSDDRKNKSVYVLSDSEDEPNFDRDLSRILNRYGSQNNSTDASCSFQSRVQDRVAEKPATVTNMSDKIDDKFMCFVDKVLEEHCKLFGDLRGATGTITDITPSVTDIYEVHHIHGRSNHRKGPNRVLQGSSSSTPIVVDDTGNGPEAIIDLSSSPNIKRRKVIKIDLLTPPHATSTADKNKTPNKAPNSGNQLECPVCLEPLVGKEVRATICGHIYCKPCIINSIKAIKKCPKCRKTLSHKQIHPLYF